MNSKKGLTLLEMLITLVVGAMVVVGFVKFSSHSTRTVSNLEQNTLLTQTDRAITQDLDCCQTYQLYFGSLGNYQSNIPLTDAKFATLPVTLRDKYGRDLTSLTRPYRVQGVPAGVALEVEYYEETGTKVYLGRSIAGGRDTSSGRSKRLVCPYGDDECDLMGGSSSTSNPTATSTVTSTAGVTSTSTVGSTSTTTSSSTSQPRNCSVDTECANGELCVAGICQVPQFLCSGGCGFKDPHDPCFLENTLIDTPSGKKAIQNLKIGDLVYSFDQKRNKTTTSRVVDNFENFARIYYTIKAADSAPIRVTGEHPLYVESKKKYVVAKNLTIGETLKLKIGENFVPTKIASIKREEGQSHKTYNLSVHPNNNYFAEGILVHNKTCDLSALDCSSAPCACPPVPGFTCVPNGSAGCSCTWNGPCNGPCPPQLIPRNCSVN